MKNKTTRRQGDQKSLPRGQRSFAAKHTPIPEAARILESLIVNLPDSTRARADRAAQNFLSIVESSQCLVSQKRKAITPTNSPPPKKCHRIHGKKSIFSQNAPRSLLDFSQHLGLYRAERMLEDVTSVLRRIPRVECVEQPFGLEFNQAGVWIGEWVELVAKQFPEIFELSDKYLEQSPYLHGSTLRDLLSARAPQPPDLPFCESLFLRVAEGFVKPGPLAKNAIAHIVFTSILIAASNTPLDSLSSVLKSYIDGSFFKTFLSRVQSTISCVQALSSWQKSNNSIPMFPLACFLVGGVRGLFLGPTSHRVCPPSGAAQHIHLMALSSSLPPNLEPFWQGTYQLILDSLREALAGDIIQIDEVRLAQVLSRDFFFHWSSTGEPLPWLRPRNRKNAPPPAVDFCSV